MGLAARTFTRLPVAYRGQDLVLYRVGGDAADVPTDRRLLAVIAHLVWLATLIGALIGTTVVFGRFRRPAGDDPAAEDNGDPNERTADSDEKDDLHRGTPELTDGPT